LSIAKEKLLTVSVAYQLRFHPAFRALLALMRSGELGRVTSARLEFGTYLPDAHPYEDYREGYAAREDLGGGAILCLIHEMDSALKLFGMPHRAYAVGGVLSDLEMTAEDTAEIIYSCGTPDRPFPVSVHLGFSQRPGYRGYKVVFTRGAAEWNHSTGELSVYDARSGCWDKRNFSSHPRNQLFVDELESFMRARERRSDPEVTLVEGVDSLRMALAARKSLRTRKAVEGFADEALSL
jgi:predicted dehydrogenase